MGWLLKFLVAVSILTMLAIPALARFPQKRIQLSYAKHKKVITVEVAESAAQHALGLMNRKSLPANEGMLFIFNSEEVREFWMKNTLINLDIAYFDKNRKVIDIQTMKAVTSVLQTQIPTYPSKRPAQYALEMNEQWFKRNGFSEGASFEVLTGPSSK